jgi:hypothetical protein
MHLSSRAGLPGVEARLIAAMTSLSRGVVVVDGRTLPIDGLTPRLSGPMKRFLCKCGQDKFNENEPNSFGFTTPQT